MLARLYLFFFKTFKLGFSNTWTENLQMYKLDLEKAKDQRSDDSLDHRKSKRIQKNIYFCFIDYAKSLCGSQQTGKFLKRWEYQATLPVS